MMGQVLRGYVAKQCCEYDSHRGCTSTVSTHGIRCAWEASFATSLDAVAAGVISMPDKREYPWFAAWDLGFHCAAPVTAPLQLPATAA